MLRRTAIPCLLAAAAVLAAGSARSADGPAVRPLPFFYDLYTFRGTADSTVILASFAVPSASLAREDVAGMVRYRFDVTLVLADTAMGMLVRTDDSVYVRMPSRPGRRHLLSTHIQVQAPPSRTTLQQAIMTDAATPGVGQLYTVNAYIPDYSGDHLMLSDLVLSQPDAERGWTRGGVTLALLPTGEFPRSAFDVYYEIYNLPAGHRYTTEIAVRRVADARGRPVEEDRPVRVRYSGASDAGPDGTLAELRFVDAAVDEGRFEISVTITNELTGASASRSRYFQVTGWETEATLVPALPRRSGITTPSGSSAAG